MEAAQRLAERLELGWVSDAWQAGLAWAQPLAAPLAAAAAPHLAAAAVAADAALSPLAPWQVAVASALLALLAAALLRRARRAARLWQDKGWRQLAAGFVLDLPLLRGLVLRQQAALRAKLRKQLAGDGDGGERLLALPEKGLHPEEVARLLQLKAALDMDFTAPGSSRVSGTVYLPGGKGDAHQALLRDAYGLFSLTNPMHGDVFPSVRRMEAEVVAMTASILGGGPAGDPNVCGAMTSGGTESILTAVKAARDYAAAVRGVTQPEMIMAHSAHAAFVKAAEYFGLRLVRLPVGPDFRLGAGAVAAAINRQTALVVASAPGFPHGVVDHVADIAKVARKKGVLLHVDCCLGGFVLPFARQLGYPVPPFDFSVRGVTSISVDTHKFGMAHKGTSVVLYRTSELRRHQYTSITDWTGGLYISPGFAGSRPGALVATAWASLLHLGSAGLLETTARIMEAAKAFEAGVSSIPGIEVVGAPEMSVVAVRASPRGGPDIYKVNDLLSKRGWHLNALQRPPSLHFCFTAAHTPATAAALLKDLSECVAAVAANPEAGGEGLAPLYGLAATIPDRRVVGDFLVAFQDIMLEG